MSNKRYWPRHWFRNLLRRLHDAWYWLRCRLWHRYNVVICRALPPTWCDRDYLLLFAAFQLLEDFVKQEQPWEFAGDVLAVYAECGAEYAREREAAWITIRELYAWWQHRKVADKADSDHDNYDEDSAMLHKLISVRGCLWT